MCIYRERGKRQRGGERERDGEKGSVCEQAWVPFDNYFGKCSERPKIMSRSWDLGGLYAERHTPPSPPCAEKQQQVLCGGHGVLEPTLPCAHWVGLLILVVRPSTLYWPTKSAAFLAGFFWLVGEKWHLELGYSKGWRELSPLEVKNSRIPASLVKPAGLGTARHHPGPPWVPHTDASSRRCSEPVTHMSDSHCRDVISCTNCVFTEKRESLLSGALGKNLARVGGSGSHKPEI